jgi:hypothetical protein
VPGSSTPQPLRARTTWEFHADERLLAAEIGIDGRVQALDALGTAYALDARGVVVLRTAHERRIRAATRMPSNAWLVADDDGLAALDDAGGVRWTFTLHGARVITCGSRGIAAWSERHPVRLLSHSGRERLVVPLMHEVHALAFCSPAGHLVAVSQQGHVTVLLGAQIAWSLHLRCDVKGLAAADNGSFIIAHRDGAQAFNVDGWHLGLYDVGRPIAAVSCSTDFSRILLADDADMIYFAEAASGACTWREARTRRTAFVRLARDGRHALVATQAGSLEALDLSEGGDRAQRLEVLTRAVAAPGIWREPSAVVEGVSPDERIALAPRGDVLARVRHAGGVIDLLDRAGAVATRLPGRTDLAALAWSDDGSVLNLLGSSGSTQVARDGSRTELRMALAHAVAGAGNVVLGITTPIPQLALYDGGTCRWSVALATPAAFLLASPGLRRIVVGGGNGVLTAFDASGARLFSVPHETRTGSVVLCGDALYLAEAGALTKLDDAGRPAWTVERSERLEIFTLAGGVFSRLAGNRFERIGEDGAILPLDERQNLGRSWLVQAGQPNELEEINAQGRVVTGFALDGRVAWRLEAQDQVNPSDAQCAAGLLVLRAGSRLLFVPLCAGAGEASSRASFLEL